MPTFGELLEWALVSGPDWVRLTSWGMIILLPSGSVAWVIAKVSSKGKGVDIDAEPAVIIAGTHKKNE